MKKLPLICLVAILVASPYAFPGGHAPATQPVYTPEGKLVLPSDYRTWIFLSSGFGMNYSNQGGGSPNFTNVYVAPEAYRQFKATGKWPNKSMFIVEEYSPASHGSINKSGQYQDKFMGLAVEVKDSSRKQEWSYYSFPPGTTAAEVFAPVCNSCHEKNAAVEHTFVQFYPTLLQFAIDKKLIKPGVDIR